MSIKQELTDENPWRWIPSLYFAEGLPYIAIMVVSGIMYKTLGISNREFAFYTAWLYLPWVIKPIWSPLVEMYQSKRYWIVLTQFMMGICFALVAFMLPTTFFFQSTMALFWLLAFSSATHDIAADGFYIINLSEYQQSWFVGIRSTFYRLAMIAGQGVIVMLAGAIEQSTGLDSITLDVRVSAANVTEQHVSCEAPSIIDSALPGEMRLVSLSGNQLNLNVGTTDPELIQSVLNKARTENTDVIKSPEKVEEADGYFDSLLAQMESFLRKHVGDKRGATLQDDTGNIGVSFFQLSKPPEPDKNINVNIGRDSGSKNISLIAGGSRVFTSENWNRPLMAVFQIDPRETEDCSAVFEIRSGNSVFAWSVSFLVLGVFFIVIALYHSLFLPKSSDESGSETTFTETFSSFFRKKGVVTAILFLLLYRLGESQLVKLAQPFMLDSQEVGGLAFSTAEVGFVYGTIGALMLTLGGILGGVIAAKYGLKKVVFPMAVAMNLPNIVYLYLAYAQPDSFIIVNLCVAFEQFGYGIGFTAFMLFMVTFAEDSGTHRTSHFAIMTGFMAMGMMFPMMISGWIQDIVGYEKFFIWVLLATMPGFIIIHFLPIPDSFGVKKKAK